MGRITSVALPFRGSAKPIVGGLTSQDVRASGQHGLFIVMAVTLTTTLVTTVFYTKTKDSEGLRTSVQKRCRTIIIGYSHSAVRELGSYPRIRH